MEQLSKQYVMTCQDVENAIIAGTAESDLHVQEHLQKCPACCEFAQFQKDLLATEAVITGNIPEFSAIKAEARRRKHEQRRFLKFAVLPLCAAAAFTLVLAGVFFHQHLEGTMIRLRNHPQPSDNTFAVAQDQTVRSWEEFYQLLDDNSSFAAALEENTVTLAWDQHSNREAQLRKSMRDARSGDHWSIEFFNPYSEDWL